MTVTVDDVRAYLGAATLKPEDEAALNDALAAAQARISERCKFDEFGPPPVVDQAITMFAARLYRRKFSVTGFEGFGELGLARVPTLDPDIEQLVSFYLRFDFA